LSPDCGNWEEEDGEVDEGVVDAGLEEGEATVVAAEGVGWVVAGWDEVPEGVGWSEVWLEAA
jgi:hypothetical protein